MGRLPDELVADDCVFPVVTVQLVVAAYRCFELGKVSNFRGALHQMMKGEMDRPGMTDPSRLPFTRTTYPNRAQSAFFPNSIWRDYYQILVPTRFLARGPSPDHLCR